MSTTENNLQQLSYHYLIGLKYALAGDLESMEILEQLSQRLQVIDWSDPAFIQFSKEMRVGVPEAKTDQNETFAPAMLALIHAQGEHIASSDEDSKIYLSEAIRAMEEGRAMQKQVLKTLTLTRRLIELHGLMRAKLEMLGVDVSPYQVPSMGLNS